MIPIRGARTISTGARRGQELERRAVERQAVVLARDAERLAEPARPRAQQARALDAAARRHHLHAVHRLERADQHRLGHALSAQTRLRHQWMPYER